MTNKRFPRWFKLYSTRENVVHNTTNTGNDYDAIDKTETGVSNKIGKCVDGPVKLKHSTRKPAEAWLLLWKVF